MRIYLRLSLWAQKGNVVLSLPAPQATGGIRAGDGDYAADGASCAKHAKAQCGRRNIDFAAVSSLAEPAAKLSQTM